MHVFTQANPEPSLESFMKSSFYLPGDTTRQHSLHRFFISFLRRLYRRLQAKKDAGSLPWIVRDLKTSESGVFVDVPVADVAWRLLRHADRTYFITNSQDHLVAHGGHYHPNGNAKKIMVCIRGSCSVELHSEFKCEAVQLASPSTALVINTATWHSARLKPDTILLVLASEDTEECVASLPCRPSSINPCTASLL